MASKTVSAVSLRGFGSVPDGPFSGLAGPVGSVERAFDLHPADVLAALRPVGGRDKAVIDRLVADLGDTAGVDGGLAEGRPMRAGDALIALRRLPFISTRLAGSGPVWATGLAAEERIGPLVDHLGSEVWVDVFRRVRQLRFVRAPGADPFLSIPITQAPFALAAGTLAGGQLITVSAGSAWFATGLVSTAPAGVYTGVRISGGTLRFSADVSVLGDQVVVPAATAVEVALEFDPPAPGPGPAGTELEAAAAVMPTGLDVDIRPAAVTLTVRGPASLTAFGAEVTLTPAGGPPRYLPDLNRLTVPMQPEPLMSRLVGTSDLFTVTGEAEITGAALALPAAALPAADLGDAAGVGALLLELGSGLAASWPGESAAAALGSALVLLDHSRLALTALTPPAGGRRTRPALQGVSAPAAFNYTRRHRRPVHFTSTADGESVATSVSAEVRLPQPVDVTGDLVGARLPGAQLVITTRHTGERTLQMVGPIDTTDTRQRAFALTNAVLRVGAPHTAGIMGRLDGDILVQGQAIAAYDLQGVLPSLPDPYATNAGLTERLGAGRRGTLVSRFQFGPGGEQLDFLLPRDLQLDVPGPGAAVEWAAVVPQSKDDPDGLAVKAAGPVFTFERQPKVVLLDVSSNASRFGVALRPPADRGRTVADGPLRPAEVANMDLAVDGRLLVLLTLPAVQWEPVRQEPGPEPFPEEVRFANSGVPTTVDLPSVDLVPVNPLAAYRTITANFAAPQPRESRARFTLPFGMVAQARLSEATRDDRGASVGEVRPTIGDLTGAHQLRIEAVDPRLDAGETPALPGFVAQLPVAIPTDGSGPRSVLGASVTTIVNGALGAGQPTALVPITRIDLSGHGESLISRWANPDDPETGVAKAEFQVLNGRAAHEVIQVKSILLPYFVPVVRTITLQRKGNAVITRRDSGWVAVRDGIFRATAASPVVTHPGVVRRITRVTNIRETGTQLTANGAQFVAAYFDGDLIVDGAGAAVPARRQLGYVKLSIPPLTAATYAALITGAGPMGGAIDATIAVGGGTQQMRLHRVGIGVAGPEFAMAAWGSPVFPGGGEWSVLESVDAVGAPAPVAADRGLPVIRQGAAGAVSAAPYRFADPEDLFDEATPARDYGILHSMGTQRAYFRRPKVEVGATDRIVSTERPVVADPLLLATGLGPFPRQADAISFPSAGYALVARSDGTWRLDAPASFPAALSRRTVRSSGTVRSDLDYSGATVMYTVDTAGPTPWRFRVERAVRIMAHTTLGDVLTSIVDVDGEAGRATRFANPTMKLGGPFSIVQDLLTVLQDLGIVAEPDVRMTNDWALKVGLTVPFVDAAGEDLKVIPGEPFPTIKFADTGLKVEQVVAFAGAEASLELGGTPMFAIKTIPGLYVVAIIKFTIKLSTETGTVYGVLLGVGIAYSFEAGPFELKGLIAITFFAVFGDSVLGYGVGFIVKLAAELPPIVSIELSLEGKLARVEAARGTPDETVFQVGKLTFAIEVSIFLVFSISLEVETKKVEVLRGPLPETAAPDVL